MQMPDYVPLREKMQFVKEAADLCFDRIELKIDKGLDSVPMPPMYKENTAIKSRVLMAAYAKLYFGEPYEFEKNQWLMTEPEYDRFIKPYYEPNGTSETLRRRSQGQGV